MPEEGRQIMYNNWKHSYIQQSDYDAASIGEGGGLRVNHLSKMLGWPNQNIKLMSMYTCVQLRATVKGYCQSAA